MIEANQVKEIAASLGADLCGIAPAERFLNAPTGFRPSDIYPDVKSVVVFAKRVLKECFSLKVAFPTPSYAIPYCKTNSGLDKVHF
jgi:epoxyqueuosine reductase QueG